jgi:membrane protease YdiL (CAAX protease family)
MICLLAPLPLALAYGGQLWREPLAVIVLAAAAAWWFRALPAGRATDFGFVLLAASPILFKWFKVLYPDPSPRLDFAFMGQLMWIRVTALAVLNDRKPERVGFGFWPRGAEWRTGLLYFAAILPAILAVNELVGFADIGWPRQSPGRALALGAGTFFGILWVVALSEELIFRGLLQPWLQQVLRNRWAGLLAASLLFGAVHLGFREFPNWRFSALAAVAGVGYGLAYERAGSIRASMVAHAALVTVWRLFFR